jgi:hypothetical protein
MVKYLRFTSVYLFALATVAGILLGGAWMWLGFAVIYAVMILGDEFMGDYFEEPDYRHPRLLNALLYGTLPGTNSRIGRRIAVPWRRDAGCWPSLSTRSSRSNTSTGITVAWPRVRTLPPPVVASISIRSCCAQ